MQHLPLKNIVVLDLTRILAGPYATMMLGDWGAEIIKIEEPEHGDDTRAWGPPFIEGESAYFLGINRNKKSFAVNLKTKKGKEIIRNLARQSDVVIENFRPGVLKSLGISLNSLRKKHPHLITCSITGYNRKSIKAQNPAYDIILQAESGLMSITGEKESPLKVGFALSDIITGMHAAYGILLALLRRAQTERGSHVEISLFDATLAALPSIAQNYLISKSVPARFGNRHPNIVPYQSFRASDEKDFVIAVGNEKHWRLLCGVIKRDELALDRRFENNALRVQNRDILENMLASIFLEKPRHQWLKKFQHAGIPAGPIQNFEEVFSDPDVENTNMLVSLHHPSVGNLSVINTPLRINGTCRKRHTAPPRLGEHTKTVLKKMVNPPRRIDHFYLFLVKV